MSTITILGQGREVSRRGKTSAFLASSTKLTRIKVIEANSLPSATKIRTKLLRHGPDERLQHGPQPTPGRILNDTGDVMPVGPDEEP